MPNPLLLVPRKIHVLRAFIAYFLGVFLLNHIIHHQTTEVYQNSGKGDQVEELFKCSGRTTAVVGKWIACLVQENVNYKGFVLTLLKSSSKNFHFVTKLLVLIALSLSLYVVNSCVVAYF